MNEENKTIPTEKKEETPRDPSIVDKAIQTAERLEAANKRTEDLLKRQEELLAREMLGGRSEAGLIVERPKELTPQEYAREVFAGKINPLKI